MEPKNVISRVKTSSSANGVSVCAIQKTNTELPPIKLLLLKENYEN